MLGMRLQCHAEVECLFRGDDAPSELRRGKCLGVRPFGASLKPVGRSTHDDLESPLTQGELREGQGDAALQKVDGAAEQVDLPRRRLPLASHLLGTSVADWLIAAGSNSVLNSLNGLPDGDGDRFGRIAGRGPQRRTEGSSAGRPKQ